MNLKILFSGLLIFIFSVSNLLFGQCGPLNTIIIEDQSQIDNFSTNYPDCTEINGRLHIEESVPGNITNLNGLSQITKVENLWIYYNSALTNLNGLNNIIALSDDAASGRLRLINNTSLENLDALENINEILQEIKIIGNTSLTSIEGLQNVSITGPNLRIFIEENPSLQNLIGLNGITSAYFLDIIENDMLINLNGLNNFTEVSYRLKIDNNQNLENLEGLNNITNVGQDGISIASNPSLETLNGLESLITTGSFMIGGNFALSNVEALANLTSSGFIFSLTFNRQLANLHGLENLITVPYLFLGNNDILNDISAIANINLNTTYELGIHDSPQLNVCDYPNICQYLNTPSNVAYIYNNAPGCNSRIEILQACGLIGIDENTIVADFSIHPNPTNGTFTISGIEEGTVQITDSRGRLLKAFTLGKDETSLNDLAEGIYFVNVRNENVSVTKRLVKI